MCRAAIACSWQTRRRGPATTPRSLRPHTTAHGQAVPGAATCGLAVLVPAQAVCKVIASALPVICLLAASWQWKE